GIYDATLDWKTCYMKEIQVRYSRSYGPGRYDPDYEWGGRDYPLGYVRWTVNRNFESCLNLMATGRLNLSPVTTRRARFEDALSVYRGLMDPGNGDIGVILEYGGGHEEARPAPPLVPFATAMAPSRQAGRIAVPCSTLDVIGAGNFTRTM